MRKKPRRTDEELRAIFEIVNQAEYKQFAKETIPFYDPFTGIYFMSTTEAVANAAEVLKEQLELTQRAINLPWDVELV